MESLFCCPVCGGALERDERGCRCAAGHSFDRAREGYVNLLSANRRHSRLPGDDALMVAARSRFLDGGWYAPLRDALCRLLQDSALPAPRVLDAGCGEGYYTAALARWASEAGGALAGVDLSKPAVRRAARRCPSGELAVASVYHLPLASGGVDAVVNCFSPLAAGEFGRVLRPGGVFLYVVPGPRHLWEMKRVLYDQPYQKEERRECYPGFSYREVVPVEYSFTLTDPRDLQALFHMTPYAWKTPREGVERLLDREEMTLTAQFRVHVLTRTGSSA